MKCSQCDEINKNYNEYCKRDGVNLNFDKLMISKGSYSIQYRTSTSCKSCNTSNSIGNSYCTNCGKEMFLIAKKI